MSLLPAAIDRHDVAEYVDSLFLVFIVLLIASVVVNWYTVFRGSLPYNAPLRGVTGFIEETTGPYLKLLRRFVPSLGTGGISLDLSPMIGIMLLFVLRAIVVGLIDG